MTRTPDSSAPSEPGEPGPAAPVVESDTVAGDGPLPSPAPPRLRRRLGLFAVAFVLGLVAVIAVSGAGLAAWDSSYGARVLPGVHVGGIDLSGLDRASAAAALRAGLLYDQGELILRTPGGDVSIPYSAFNRRADVDALVDAALGSARTGDLATRVVSQLGQAVHGVSLAAPVVFDGQALAAAVTAALAPLDAGPVDATIAVTHTGYAVTPARDGSSVDAAPVIAAAVAAVEQAGAAAQIVIPVTASPVPAVVSDEAVRAAAFRAGLITSSAITITSGKRSWTITAATIRTWVGFSAAPDGSLQPTIDLTKIPAALKSVAKKLLTPATSAVFLHAKSGTIVGVAASADGKQLDLAATSRRISDALLARIPAFGIAAPVKVAMAPVPPKLTTAQAKQKAPVLTLLGTWTTYFPISDHNYFGANIWIPAQIINGTVLAAGQTLDWWNAVGDVTPARGFGPGGVIQGDHTDPTGALGGGMCSSSTTLFNAALRAGLQMGARGNHRYYINRYPLGLDATVWKVGTAVQDMSFTNDTGNPILILGIKSSSGSAGYVTYQLWGTPDGRSVSLSSPSVTNVVQATTTTQLVGTLPHGVRNQTEYPSNEMDVAVTRQVKDKGGRLIHSEVWSSHYVLWNGIIQIGR